jgi:hypothetical protein
MDDQSYNWVSLHVQYIWISGGIHLYYNHSLCLLLDLIIDRRVSWTEYIDTQTTTRCTSLLFSTFLYFERRFQKSLNSYAARVTNVIISGSLPRTMNHCLSDSACLYTPSISHVRWWVPSGGACALKPRNALVSYLLWVFLTYWRSLGGWHQTRNTQNR